MALSVYDDDVSHDEFVLGHFLSCHVFGYLYNFFFSSLKL